MKGDECNYNGLFSMKPLLQFIEYINTTVFHIERLKCWTYPQTAVPFTKSTEAIHNWILVRFPRMKEVLLPKKLIIKLI